MEQVKILLVDNNPTFLRITARFLSAEDWIEILGRAGDGLEALDLASELEPDVILLDLNMPGLGGLEAMPRLRRLVPGARIIALTLLDTEGYREAAIEAGAHSFVPKSAMNRELIPAIRAVLEDDEGEALQDGGELHEISGSNGDLP
ncbi:MAG: response regulator transcription factor [Anaerolineales bacterium]|nr:response regulator transcription factor [Anaerolineales bacterium]